MGSPIARLKMPFVVTVATATGACGGTVTGSGGVGDGIGGGASGAAGASSAGGSESTGGASNGGAPTGGGGSSSGGGPMWTGGVSSRGGQQQGGAGGSIDPPPPPTMVCPSTAPVATTYCNYVGPPCTYGDCNGIPVTVVTCVPDERVSIGGFWSVSTSTCKPPPTKPVCPTSAPFDGAPCSDEGLSCTYQQFAGCPEWDTSATCKGGIWSVGVKICG